MCPYLNIWLGDNKRVIPWHVVAVSAVVTLALTPPLRLAVRINLPDWVSRRRVRSGMRVGAAPTLSSFWIDQEAVYVHLELLLAFRSFFFQSMTAAATLSWP